MGRVFHHYFIRVFQTCSVCLFIRELLLDVSFNVIQVLIHHHQRSLLLVRLLSHLLTESEVQPLPMLIKLLLPFVLVSLERHVSFFNRNLLFSFFQLTGDKVQLFVQFHLFKIARLELLLNTLFVGYLNRLKVLICQLNLYIWRQVLSNWLVSAAFDRRSLNNS